MVKEITLTNGDIIIVDDIDYDEVIKHKWELINNKHICSNTTQYKDTIRLNRLIGSRKGLQDDKSVWIGYLNGNQYDNTRANIVIKRRDDADTTLHHIIPHILTVVDTTEIVIDNIEYVLQVTLLPLNAEYKPHKKHLPFQILLKPPSSLIGMNNTNSSMIHLVEKAINHGMDRSTAISIFEDWFYKLDPSSNTHIVPLSYNWLITRDSLIKIFGKLHFNKYFHSNGYRDINQVMNYIFDRKDYQGEALPNTFKAVYERLRDEDIPIDSIMYCIKIANVYRELIRRFD